MKALGDLLKNFNPEENRYISREFQSFGVHLAEKLNDSRRKALYIKYAKYIPRPVLEEALRFVIDSNAKSKGALFMWKLKELNAFEKYPLPSRTKKKTTAKAPRKKTAHAQDSTSSSTPKTKPPKKTARASSSAASRAQQRLDLPDSA